MRPPAPTARPRSTRTPATPSRPPTSASAIRRDPDDGFLSVVITTLPAAGTLTLDGDPVDAGDVVLVSELGDLVFTPAANANGTPYASFTFQVQDDGGTANGGVDLDQSANTFTINVTSVNDAPAGTDDTVTINEDGSLHLRGRRLRLQRSDRRSRRTASWRGQITTLPAAGTLTLDGDRGRPPVSRSRSPTSPRQAGRSPRPPTPTAPPTPASPSRCRTTAAPPTAASISTRAPTRSPSTSPRSTTRRPAPTTRSRSTRTPAYTFAAADFGFSDPNDIPANALPGGR